MAAAIRSVIHSATRMLDPQPKDLQGSRELRELEVEEDDLRRLDGGESLDESALLHKWLEADQLANKLAALPSVRIAKKTPTCLGCSIRMCS